MLQLAVSGDGLVGDLERSYLQLAANVPDLSGPVQIDLAAVKFIDPPGLIWLLSLLSSRHDKHYDTYLRLPEDKSVRDFLTIWEFPRAYRHVTGQEFHTILSDTDAALFLNELQQGVDETKYAGNTLHLDTTEQRLLSDGFFEILTFTPKKVASPMRLAEEEHSRWQDDRLISILNRHLKNRASTLSSHVVHEAMMNSLRHPGCSVILTTSSLVKHESFSFKNEYGIRHWRKFTSYLWGAANSLDDIYTPTKRLLSLLPSEFRLDVLNGPDYSQSSKWRLKIVDALDALLNRTDLLNVIFHDIPTVPLEFSSDLRANRSFMPPLQLNRTNRRLIETLLGPHIVPHPAGHFTLVYWDDGESIVDTLKSAIQHGLPIQSARKEELKDLYSAFNVKWTDAYDKILLREAVHSDRIPTPQCAPGQILLSSVFPGITRDVSGHEHTVHPSIAETNKLLALPGMGLYILSNEVLNVFEGSVSIRTGSCFMNLSLGYDSSRKKEQRAKIRDYSTHLPLFKGNMLTVRLQLK